jgi:IS605 OrfB family transposase
MSETTVTRTLVQEIRFDSLEQEQLIRELCHYSKNLYNEALYAINQKYEETSSNEKPHYMNYYETDAYMKSINSTNYRMLPSGVAQQTLQILDKNYKSFFGSLKGKSRGTITHKVHIPKYLPKDGYNVLCFNYTNFHIDNSCVTLSLAREYVKLHPESKFLLTFKLSPLIKILEHKYVESKYYNSLKMIRIVPKNNKFKIEFVYTTPIINAIQGKGHISIDLGLSNFATYITSNNSTGIIDGRYIKSVNQWYNKENSRLQSIKDKMHLPKSLTVRQSKLLEIRNNKIKEFMNRSIDYLIKLCEQEAITTLVIGELKNIKQEANLGRRNNQNFVQIPYDTFKQKLKAKCELHDIKYVEVNEAYTSKTDALALDTIGKQVRDDRRVKRGLYQSSTGTLINADVNGAMNIMRKVAGDSIINEIVSRGVPNTPRRIRLAYEQTPSKLNERISVHSNIYGLTDTGINTLRS